jgi:uncharacterized protein YchJ
MSSKPRSVAIRFENCVDCTVEDTTMYGGDSVVDFVGFNRGMRVNRVRGVGTRHVVSARGRLYDSTFEDIKHLNVMIGQNDPCWCGSGKKFKHCHRR